MPTIDGIIFVHSGYSLVKNHIKPFPKTHKYLQSY